MINFLSKIKKNLMNFKELKTYQKSKESFLFKYDILWTNLDKK